MPNTSAVDIKYFDANVSPSFGGGFAMAFGRTTHAPLDLSSVQPFYTYFMYDVEGNGSTANMYRGMLLAVTNDDNTAKDGSNIAYNGGSVTKAGSSVTYTRWAYAPHIDQTGRTGLWYSYGYLTSNKAGDPGTYLVDRILTKAETENIVSKAIGDASTSGNFVTNIGLGTNNNLAYTYGGNKYTLENLNAHTVDGYHYNSFVRNIGRNVVTDKEVLPTYWAGTVGPGYEYLDGAQTGTITNSLSTSASFLLNLIQGSTDSAQILYTRNGGKGDVYVRHGNTTGWYLDWTLQLNEHNVQAGDLLSIDKSNSTLTFSHDTVGTGTAGVKGATSDTSTGDNRIKFIGGLTADKCGHVSNFVINEIGYATTTAGGLMSAEDKDLLGKLNSGEFSFELKAATSNKLGGIKIGYPSSDASNDKFAIKLVTASGVDQYKAYVEVPLYEELGKLSNTYVTKTELTSNTADIQDWVTSYVTTYVNNWAAEQDFCHCAKEWTYTLTASNTNIELQPYRDQTANIHIVSSRKNASGTTELVDWTIATTALPAWLSVSKSSNAVIITAKENLDAAKRTANIVIKQNDENGKSITLVVTQLPAEIIYTLQFDTIGNGTNVATVTVDPTAKTTNFSDTAFVSFKTINGGASQPVDVRMESKSDDNFITSIISRPDSVSGITRSLSIICAENVAEATRTGTITISQTEGNAASLSLIVTQSEAKINYILSFDFSSGLLQLDYNAGAYYHENAFVSMKQINGGEYIPVPFTFNTSSYDNFISNLSCPRNSEKSYAGYSLRFDYTKNESQAARTGTITIRQSESNKNQSAKELVYNVTQTAYDDPVIGVTNTFTFENGSKTYVEQYPVDALGDRLGYRVYSYSDTEYKSGKHTYEAVPITATVNNHIDWITLEAPAKFNPPTGKEFPLGYTVYAVFTENNTTSGRGPASITITQNGTSETPLTITSILQDPGDDPYVLSCKPNPVNLYPTGDAVNVTVTSQVTQNGMTSNTDFTVKAPIGSWFTAAKQLSIIKVSATENTGTERTGSFTVSNAGKEVTVNVVQGAAKSDYELYASQSSVSLSPAGETVRLTVTSTETINGVKKNIDWNIVGDGNISDNITAKKENDTTLVIQGYYNTVGDSGTVTIANAHTTYSISVTQPVDYVVRNYYTFKFSDTTNTSKADNDFDNTGGTHSFTIYSFMTEEYASGDEEWTRMPIDVIVSSDAYSWLNYSTAEYSTADDYNSGFTLSLNANANTGGRNTGSVTITQNNGSSTRLTINVAQKSAEVDSELYTTTPSVFGAATGLTQTLNVVSTKTVNGSKQNITWQVDNVNAVSWCTITPNVAGKTITLTATENRSTEGRAGTFTISNSEETYTVTLRQEAGWYQYYLEANSSVDASAYNSETVNISVKSYRKMNGTGTEVAVNYWCEIGGGTKTVAKLGSDTDVTRVVTATVPVNESFTAVTNTYFVNIVQQIPNSDRTQNLSKKIYINVPACPKPTSVSYWLAWKFNGTYYPATGTSSTPVVVSCGANDTGADIAGSAYVLCSYSGGSTVKLPLANYAGQTSGVYNDTYTSMGLNYSSSNGGYYNYDRSTFNITGHICFADRSSQTNGYKKRSAALTLYENHNSATVDTTRYKITAWLNQPELKEVSSTSYELSVESSSSGTWTLSDASAGSKTINVISYKKTTYTTGDVEYSREAISTPTQTNSGWVTVSSPSNYGSGTTTGYTYTLTVAANTTTSQRDTTITFAMASQSSKQDKVRVVQPGMAPDEITSTENVFQVIDYPVIIPSNQSSVTIKVKSAKVDIYKSGKLKYTPATISVDRLNCEQIDDEGAMFTSTSSISIPSTSSFSEDGVATITATINTTKKSNNYGRRATITFKSTYGSETITITQSNTTSAQTYMFFDPVDNPTGGYLMHSSSNIYVLITVYAAKNGRPLELEYYIEPNSDVENLYSITDTSLAVSTSEYYGTELTEVSGNISIPILQFPQLGKKIGTIYVREKVSSTAAKRSMLSVDIIETDRYSFGNPFDSEFHGGLTKLTADIWNGASTSDIGYVDSYSRTITEGTWNLGPITPIAPTVQSKPAWISNVKFETDEYNYTYNITVTVSAFNNNQTGDLVLKQPGSNKTFTYTVTWHLGNNTSGGSSDTKPSYTFTWSDGSTSMKTITVPGWSSSYSTGKQWGQNIIDSTTAKQIVTSKTVNGSTQYIDITGSPSSLFLDVPIYYYQGEDIDYAGGTNHSGNNALMICEINPNNGITQRTINGTITQPESGKKLNISFVQEPRYSLTFEPQDGKYDVTFTSSEFYSSSWKDISITLDVTAKDSRDSGLSPNISYKFYRSGNDVTSTEIEHGSEGTTYGYRISFRGKSDGTIPIMDRNYQLKVTESSFGTTITINIKVTGRTSGMIGDLVIG